MKIRFLMTMTLVTILLVAIFGVTGAYGSTTEDVLRVDGIDVSQWNGDVDWQKAKVDGQDFVFLRIGGRGYGEKGIMYFDDNLKVYFDGAKEADMMVGGYFFSQAITVEEAIEEAEYVHNKILEWGIDPAGFDLPIFVDREFSGDEEDLGRLTLATLSIEEEVEIELAFCNKLRKYGYESGLYSYLSFLNDNTDSTVLSDQGYPVWVAQYNDQCDYEYPYDLWQFTDNGRIDGLPGATDRDYWYLNKSLAANPKSNFRLDNCSIELKSVPVYNGTAITPTYAVKHGTTTLKENVDYKVIGYIDNIELGTGYAVIRGLNSYTGYRAIPFQIIDKLDTPKNVKITTVASSGKPMVSWDPVNYASGYEIYRKVGNESQYKYYYTTDKLSFVNTSAAPGTTYYYKVKAILSYNKAAKSNLSDYGYITCDLARPTMTLSTVESSGKPKVTWTKVDGASKYEVWRKIGEDGEYKPFYTTTNLSMTNTSAEAGKRYYYKVKAIYGSNSAANSAFSNSDYITCDLARPTMTLSTVASSGKPKVTWTKVDGASKYEVWRKIGEDGEYKPFYTTTNLSMTNTSAEAGKRYYYKVKAIYGSNSAANSAFSNSDYRTCDLARPVMKPTVLSTLGKPTISWYNVDGASEYIIYRKVGETGEFSKYYTTTSTSFTNVSAIKGVRYYYKVVAVCTENSAANSAYGNIAYMISK